MKSNREIAKAFRKRKALSERGLSTQMDNSGLCDAFYDGDYMNYKDDIVIGVLSIKGVQFNKVQPYVNAVSGFMIQTRREAKYYPRISDISQRTLYSKQANGLKDYVRRNARADQVESQADTQMLIKGYAATETAMSYGEGYATTDPNGEIIMDDVTNDVRWDPMARKKNLLDARYCYYRKSFALEDAKTLFDDGKDADFETAVIEDATPWQFDPTLQQPYDRSRIVNWNYDWDSRANETVWVYFYQWCETEKFYRADNPVFKLTNPLAQQAAMLKMDQIEAEAEAEDSMFAFDGTAPRLMFDETTKNKLEEAFEDLIKPYPFNRKVFYTAVLSGDKVFSAYRSQCQQGFSVKFKTGIWNNSRRIWTGMVNPMMEPAKYYNKGLTELMFLIANNSKGGYFVEEGATKNIRDFENNVGRTNAVIKLNPGGLAKIKAKAEMFSPQGYDQVVTLADSAVADASGVDKNFVMRQSGSGNMTAMLHRQIIRQVTSTLAPYFDAREAYQEEQARLLLDFLAVWAENNEGAVVRILGEQGADEFLEVSQDPFAAEYDVKIEEAPQTDEEQMEQANQLITMGDKLLAVGDTTGKKFYIRAVQIMKLDEETKRGLAEDLAPTDDPRIAALEAQIQQLTSGMAQAQQRALEAATELTKAKVDDTMASVQKKAADISKTATEIDQLTAETSMIPQAERVTVSV